ncbi:MAG: hypothetical protein WD207_05705 [Xanthobacteraceae bacterium]
MLFGKSMKQLIFRLQEVPMVRQGRGAAGWMAAVAAAAVTGTIMVLSVAVLANHVATLHVGEAKAAEPTRQSDAVNRDRKSAPLAMPPAKQARVEIKSVEVIGIRDASIIYRDRDGNVLFRTDPLANVTVVAKNVDLPEVTIRESAETEVDRLPVEGNRPSTPPHGCESSFARPSPTALTRIPSRCLTQTESGTNVAALR